MGAFTVLHLLDGVVVPGVDDDFLLHLGACDVVDERPTDSTTAAGVDESVLWTCVEGILAVDKLGMEHHIALL